MRPGDRVFHYFVDGTSLCRRVGLYNGPLMSDSGELTPGEDDCKQCFKKLIKRRNGKHD